MRRTMAVGCGAVLLVTALTGCTSGSIPAPTFCVPRITIEPRVVQPGGTIVMTSDTRCDAASPDGGWTVLIAPIGKRELGARADVTGRFDGSFRAEVDIPTTFLPGEAFAEIEDWDYSGCADQGSCASASGDFMVVP